MKSLLSTLLIVSLASSGRAVAEERFACNDGALTKAQWATHNTQSHRLLAAVQERRELPNGYAFRLPPEELSNTADWAALEEKCCPFFTFELELTKHEGPLWLRVTGADGVKAFIRQAFTLDALSKK
jgi:hypothetical protein